LFKASLVHDIVNVSDFICY